MTGRWNVRMVCVAAALSLTTALKAQNETDTPFTGSMGMSLTMPVTTVDGPAVKGSHDGIREGKDNLLRRFWTSAPDSILPYLDRSLRQELTDYIDMKVRAEVKNPFGGSCVMDTLTADYLKVTLTGSSLMEIKMLPAEGDTVFCVVRTYGKDLKESDVTLYDKQWNRVGTVPAGEISSFTVMPADMSGHRYGQLCEWLDPAMVYATLSPESEQIVFQVNAPFVPTTDKKDLHRILRQKSLTWTGKGFN